MKNKSILLFFAFLFVVFVGEFIVSPFDSPAVFIAVNLPITVLCSYLWVNAKDKSHKRKRGIAFSVIMYQF